MLTRLKQKIRVYFGCSEQETNGLLLLVPLMLLILYAPSLLKIALNTDPSTLNLEDEKILKAWLLESKSKIHVENKVELVPTFFNPNRINRAKWISLGFKEKIADRILNYRSKGGSFREKEDLLNIYGINEKLVKDYFNYIIIPKTKRKETEKPKQFKTSEESEKAISVKYDLNEVDSIQLQSIRGIGPVLSARIIKFRELLGGYSNINQLEEVYGIKPEVYQRAIKQLELKTFPSKKININRDSISTLAKHPYLSYKTSRAIVKYRNQHGDFQLIEDLKKIYTISDSLFVKIAPYLETESVE